MSVFLGFDGSHRVLMIRFSGVLTEEGMLAGYKRAREWFQKHGACNNISDFSDIEEFHITSRLINQMASRSPLVPASFTRVIIAPRDDVYGMARMFQTLSSSTGSQLELVRTRQEAYALTGIEDPNFEAVQDA